MVRQTILAILLLLISVASQAQTPVVEPCALDNYQAGQRPIQGPHPTQVSLGLTMVDLIAINDLNQTVTLDAVLNVRWQDPRLANNIGCRFSLQQIWHPDIQLVNSGDVTARQPLELLVEEEGWLQGGFRLRGSVADPRNMAEFPFDGHNIVLDIMSLRYSRAEVIFEVEEAWTLRRQELTIPDWKIGAVSAQIENVLLPQVNRVASTYRFNIPAERMPRYFIYKIIMPLTMIVFMSWAVFWVDPKNLGPQMTLAGTSMLTLVTFQFTMNDLLPRVGYFTQLDQFILSCSVLVFLALLEAVSAGYFASNNKEKLAKVLDRTSRITFPSVYAFIVVLTLVI